jgi:hypothetical protein
MHAAVAGTANIGDVVLSRYKNVALAVEQGGAPASTNAPAASGSARTETQCQHRPV